MYTNIFDSSSRNVIVLLQNNTCAAISVTAFRSGKRLFVKLYASNHICKTNGSQLITLYMCNPTNLREKTQLCISYSSLSSCVCNVYHLIHIFNTRSPWIVPVYCACCPTILHRNVMTFEFGLEGCPLRFWKERNVYS